MTAKSTGYFALIDQISHGHLGQRRTACGLCLPVAPNSDCNGRSNLAIAFKSRPDRGSVRRHSGSAGDARQVCVGKHLWKTTTATSESSIHYANVRLERPCTHLSGIHARQQDQVGRSAGARSAHREHHRPNCRNRRSLTSRGFPHIYAARAVLLPAFRRLHRVEDAPLCIQPVERQSDIIAPPRPRGRAPSSLRLSAGPHEAAARDFAYSKDTF